jgi:hypothetical protein
MARVATAVTAVRCPRDRCGHRGAVAATFLSLAPDEDGQPVERAVIRVWCPSCGYQDQVEDD